jgi:uncharacterized protein YgiM (DUF1202 family)
MRTVQRLMVSISIPALLALAACQPIQMPDGVMEDAAAAAATAAPAEDTAASPMADEVMLDEDSAIATIATRSLRVRQAPGEDAEVIYGVGEGERYNVLDISPDGAWVQLAIADAPDGAGWVAAGLVVVEGELTGAAAAPSDATEEAAPAAAATAAPTEEAAEEATAEAAAETGADETAAATAVPQEELAPPAAGFVQIVTDGTRLRVRSEPNTDAEIAGYVYNGEEYELLGQSDDGLWVQIAGSTAAETDNPDGGWVAAEFVIIGQ